jgi:hypothetical protein
MNKDWGLQATLEHIDNARFVYVDFNSIFGVDAGSKELATLKSNFQHVHACDKQYLHRLTWPLRLITNRLAELIRAIRKKRVRLTIISTTEEEYFIMTVMNYFFDDYAVMTVYHYNIPGLRTYQELEKRFKDFLEVGDHYFGNIFKNGPYSNQKYQQLMADMRQSVNFADKDFRDLGIVLLDSNDEDLKVANSVGIKAIKIEPGFNLKVVPA